MISKTKAVLAIIAALGISAISHSAEVDQFTDNDKPLKDSSLWINNKANLLMDVSIDTLNEEGKGCNEKELYQELRKYYGNHLHGILTKAIIKSEEIEKRHFEFKDSVYKRWNSGTGFILGNPLLRKSELAMSDVVRVGNVEVGTDKFEHFFGRGFLYFTKHYLKNKSIESTLKYGTIQERYILGGMFLETGIFSYGDLAANFNGMRFWNHILLKNDDILGSEHNLGPYVVCKDNRWVKNQNIDFTNYFDNTFNEAYNCSKFATDKGANYFKKELEKQGKTCGFAPGLTSTLESKYGEYSKWILNYDGLGKVEFSDAFGE